MQGRSVLVTGATQGIGGAVAEILVAAGARVVIAARTESRLRSSAERLGCDWLAVDLATPAAVERTADQVRTRLGAVPDAVVSAAGAFALSDVERTSAEALERMLALNLRVPFDWIRCFLPEMKARGHGDLLHVGSVAGRRAFPGNAGYSASKFGLRGLHEVLVAELAGTGVRSTLIEPAAVDTPLWDPIDPDADPTLPSRGQMLQPADVAEAILFALTRPAHVCVPLIQIQRA
ncbi:MAG: SDR family oxidoreductase [Gemmatimonadota bacterium]